MNTVNEYLIGSDVAYQYDSNNTIKRGALMNIFTQHNPTKLYFGKGQISQLSAEVRQNESPSCIWWRKH